MNWQVTSISERNLSLWCTSEVLSIFHSTHSFNSIHSPVQSNAKKRAASLCFILKNIWQKFSGKIWWYSISSYTCMNLLQLHAFGNSLFTCLSQLDLIYLFFQISPSQMQPLCKTVLSYLLYSSAWFHTSGRPNPNTAAFSIIWYLFIQIFSHFFDIRSSNANRRC